MTKPIPQIRALDETIAFMQTPYDFVSSRCHSQSSDLFQTRLFLQKTICMQGPDLARLFYDPERFVRLGAAPEPARATLFGKGGVQSMDDEAHRHRKQMFMGFMGPESIAKLVEFVSGLEFRFPRARSASAASN